MTALKAADVDAFVARPDAARPFVLIYGPDSGLVSERAQTIVRAASGRATKASTSEALSAVISFLSASS